MPIKKYHIYKDSNKEKRSTISLDAIVADLLAIKLKHQPDTPEANQAVRAWLQSHFDNDLDPDRHNSSQWIQAKAILEIADKKLSNKYWDWRGC